MKALPFILFALAFVAHSGAQDPAAAGAASPVASPAGPVISVGFTNAQLSPSHWTLSFRPDGSGHFHSEMGTVNSSPGQLRTPSISRDIQFSPEFAASAFKTAQRHSFFNQDCESHMKVAFQGDKMLSYSGADGKGSCTFNYSRDRDIQTLADNFMAVAETIIAGERLEILLQHDRLGLDKETENLVQAAQSGRAQQLCVIRSILERLAQDDQVLDMVRKRARTLLAHAES